MVKVLREHGHTALFAGGCVRDLLLGRPANDFDVATSATPEQVRALFKRTLLVGEQFGIVIVRLKGQQIEVATFRVDYDYTDGRRPDRVEYTADPALDAERRDFTVNGLFLDPFSGEIHDYVGGEEDLRRGRIRAIGDPAQRFEEDRLRILRAPRFAAALGFTIEERTAAEARARAREIETAHVSAERIRTELEKVLAVPARARGVALCHELGILEVVLPEAVAAVAPACRALAALPEDASRPLAWATLLHAAPPAAVDAALRRLRLSNKDREAAVHLVRDLAPARELASRSLAEQKRLLRAADADALLELLRAGAIARGGDLEPTRYLAARLAAYRDDPTPSGLAARPLLSGKDLQTAGLPAGRLFSRLLAAAEDAQLEGRVRTREEALSLALALAAEGGA